MTNDRPILGAAESAATEIMLDAESLAPPEDPAAVAELPPELWDASRTAYLAVCEVIRDDRAESYETCIVAALAAAWPALYARLRREWEAELAKAAYRCNTRAAWAKEQPSSRSRW